MADTKWSQFPSVNPENSDMVVGLHAGGNARFTVANLVAAVRQGLVNLFVPRSSVGAANGVAGLDSNGKVPSTQLPTMPSNVEANPSGEATDNLTKLQVDDTIYAVSGGGGVDYLTVVDGKICVIYEV